MTMISRFALMLTLVAFPGLAFASDPQEISWDLLSPPAEEMIDDPFKSLTSGQIDVLRSILRLETRAEANDDADARAEAAALRGEMAAQGLDVDALFAARLVIMEHVQRAYTAVNEDIVGSPVRMPGYLLPLEFDGRRVVEFLLVPTVGACIHTPPPAPNQIVHVLYPDGIEVDGLYTPVWISGVMTAQQSVQNVGYVDGQAPVSVSYSMQPVLVEEYGG